jgi:hypothetical protein
VPARVQQVFRGLVLPPDVDQLLIRRMRLAEVVAEPALAIVNVLHRVPPTKVLVRNSGSAPGTWTLATLHGAFQRACRGIDFTPMAHRPPGRA